MSELETFARKVNSHEDFIHFLELYIQDLKANPHDWENRNLEDYLEAMQSWTEDMDGYYTNMNLPYPKDVNWKVFVDILMGARIYE